MSNLVSIIIPVYNSEKYIGKCLDSILVQSYQDFEIQVINDGSKDDSIGVIRKYESKYPEKIKVIDQKNKGVAVTRNEGIKRANGKYIMFMDNDDYIEKNYIETFVRELEDGDYDAVIGGYVRRTEEGKIVRTLKLEDKEWSKMMILAPWTKIYKKQYLIDNNIEFLNVNIGEDIYFNLKALLLSDKIKIIDYVGYTWLFNTKSLSNANQKNITKLQVYDLLNNCYDMLKTTGILEKKKEIIETHYIRYIVWLLSFSTKGLNYKTLSQEYDKLFAWLEERFPDYKKFKNISFTKPIGEAREVRVLTEFFMIFHKLHIGKLATYIYNKF